MSRIQRAPVQPGDTTEAATLDATYADYAQAGALDANNARDQAFDLPHFKNVPIILNTAAAVLGNSPGMLHSGVLTTVNSTTDLAALLHHTVPSTAGPASLDLSLSPWVMAAGDVLRLWWNLSVEPTFTGTPWDNVSALGRYTLPDPGGGNTVLTDGLHLWVMYLEWDITSGSLVNFVPVPGQSDFATDLFDFSANGAKLGNTSSTSAISPWSVFSHGTAVDGETPDRGVSKAQGWFANYGMWAYPATGAVTVYGLRLVITGVLHPMHDVNVNCLIYDINVAAVLKYTGGRINAVHMRGS